MEYYSGIKKREVLIPATTWMNLQNIILSERSHTQKGHMLYESLYMKGLD